MNKPMVSPQLRMNLIMLMIFGVCWLFTMVDMFTVVKYQAVIVSIGTILGVWNIFHSINLMDE